MRKLLLLFALAISNFAVSQEWQTNFEEAKKIATEQDKNVVIVFSGSDWCAPCIKLDKNIWQSEAFKKEAKEENSGEKTGKSCTPRGGALNAVGARFHTCTEPDREGSKPLFGADRLQP